MGIKRVEKKGKITFQVTVELKSKADPSIRRQKKRTGIKTEAEAKRWERKLREEAQMEIYHREQTGDRWDVLLATYFDELEKGTATDRPVSPSTVENYK